MATRVSWFVLACGLAWVAAAAAQGPLNANTTIADNLRALQPAKKPVTVVLKGGTTYSGKIGAVGDHELLLTELTGKEFYDVLVAIDEIAGVEVRAR